MLHRISTALLVLAWITKAVEISGGPASPISIETLKDKADLILVGSVNDRLAIRVTRVLKGDLSPGTLLDIEWQLPDDVSANLDNQEAEGLWFLKNTGRGTWKPMPTVTGEPYFRNLSFPASRTANTRFAYDSSATLIDKIALELGSAADTRGDLGFDFFFAVLSGLKSAESPAIVGMFERFANSQSPKLKALGLAALIQRGRSDALVKMEAQIGELSRLDETSLIVHNIFGYYQNPDPAGIQALARLAKTVVPIPHLQSSAAHALRILASRETLPYFAELIESSDRLVRYEAACGFATFALFGSEPLEERLKRGPRPVTQPKGEFATKDTIQHYPSLSAFQEDEEKYTQFWKRWWKESKPKISK
jgi:hypothetical protein